MITYRLELTEPELLSLDGHCSAAVQETVDGAKLRQLIERDHGCSPEIAQFVTAAVNEARREGRLVYIHERIRSCPVCLRDAGYAQIKRSSGWLRRKGDPDHSKPLSMSAIELAYRFVRFQHRVAVGCCMECFEAARPVLAAALALVRAEIPEALTGAPARFRRFHKRRCTACQWEGHEGQMGKLPTLFNDGHYAGECPKCGAENAALGRTIIEHADGFEVVEA